MQTLNIPRDQLPQINDKSAFQEWLTKNNISHSADDCFPASGLKPIQFDYDQAKIDSIIKNAAMARTIPVIAAEDRYILDGHHRWRAIMNTHNWMLSVIFVHVPIGHLIALGRQFAADQPLNIKEMTNQDPNLLFEEMFPESDAVASPSDPGYGDPGYGDPGYVLKRLKKVPIHTQFTKPAIKTGSTTVGTEYDKIAPTQVKEDEDDDESGNVPGETADNQTGLATVANAVPAGMSEAMSPRDKIRNVFNNRNALKGKSPVPDRPRPVKHEPKPIIAPGEDKGWKKLDWVKEDTQVATRTSKEIEDIKAKYKAKQMPWADAHKELLHRGMSVSDIPKHLGEAKDMNLLQKGRKAIKDCKEKSQSKGKKDVVNLDPSLQRFPAAS